MNTVPGFTQKSIIPQQALAMGIELSEFFNLLLLEVLDKN
ncbi:hypothetical protein N8Z50_02625 [Flavobacteriaceae bacterium]|nr:hypothetical protein [Flavobacteriaceae bacterium]